MNALYVAKVAVSDTKKNTIHAGMMNAGNVMAALLPSWVDLLIYHGWGRYSMAKAAAMDLAKPLMGRAIPV